VNTPDRDRLALGRTDDGTVVFCRPGDSDVELIDAIRDGFDRVDPVPPQALLGGDRFATSETRSASRSTARS
jgi:hypothetical protein